MKFRRAYRHRGLNGYTIRPHTRYTENGMTMTRYPLRAQFVDGFWDSEATQKSMGWSNEEREQVEQYLLTHDDFGHGLFLDSSEPGAGPYVATETEATEEEQEKSLTVCIASVETDGESKLCGRPTVGDSEFCAKHIEEFAQTGV